LKQEARVDLLQLNSLKTGRVSNMSSDLSEVLNRLENLSVEELLTVQESLTKNVRKKVHSSTSVGIPGEPTTRRIGIPGTYRATPQEIEAHLKSVFTSEQLAEIAQTDISNLTLPPGAKTTAEILREDREDRF
jgi:hypothetical protein